MNSFAWLSYKTWENNFALSGYETKKPKIRQKKKKVEAFNLKNSKSLYFLEFSCGF